LSSDAFGFERLDQVYTAVYRLSGGDVTAFLSHRADESSAAELTEVYYGFLLENGGVPLPGIVDLPGSKVVDILGGVEVIFNRGPVFAGVHDAANGALAEEMALKLEHRLTEVVNGK
ncbi:MAG: hypothetical protein JRK53_11925, partial [Deltaproteobacteria bacterium]|nr:hypothetical protein [Deltaproteobacteria bacterium]